jgi:hypothetical protein
MAATKVQANWSSVSWNSTSITRVTSVSIGQGGNLLKFKGDTDIYPTVIAALDIEPHASVTTADVAVIMGFTPGVSSSLTATQKDAKGASGGEILWTVANAVFENGDQSGAHAQWGTVTGTWQCFSSDGSTNPVSFTRA